MKKVTCHHVLGTVRCTNKLQLPFQNGEEIQLLTTFQKQPHDCRFLLLQCLRYISPSPWSVCYYFKIALGRQILCINCICRGIPINSLLEFTYANSIHKRKCYCHKSPIAAGIYQLHICINVLLPKGKDRSLLLTLLMSKIRIPRSRI